MVLPKLRPSAPATLDPFERPVIAPLADDPDYARETALLKALTDRNERRKRELSKLAYEAHFAGKPLGKDGARDAQLRTALAKISAEPSYFDSGNTDPAPLTVPPPALARGLELLRSGKAEPAMTRQQMLDQLHRDGGVLEEAIAHQAGVVAELKAVKSYELCLHLKTRHDAVLLAFLRAAQEFAAITDAERAFRAAVLSAGYEERPDLIGAPFITAPLHLGSERVHDSQISTYRRHLQDKGIIS